MNCHFVMSMTAGRYDPAATSISAMGDSKPHHQVSVLFHPLMGGPDRVMLFSRGAKTEAGRQAGFLAKEDIEVGLATAAESLKETGRLGEEHLIRDARAWETMGKQSVTLTTDTALHWHRQGETGIQLVHFVRVALHEPYRL